MDYYGCAAGASGALSMEKHIWRKVILSDNGKGRSQRIIHLISLLLCSPFVRIGLIPTCFRKSFCTVIVSFRSLRPPTFFSRKYLCAALTAIMTHALAIACRRYLHGNSIGIQTLDAINLWTRQSQSIPLISMGHRQSLMLSRNTKYSH